MKKNIIRLNESQLYSIIEKSVKKVLKETTDWEDLEDMMDLGGYSLTDDEKKSLGAKDEYNPWMNGDASYIEGSYTIPYGFKVDIDASLGTVSIKDIDGNEENSHFLQGDEADELIKEIAKYWAEHNVSAQDAVNTIIQGLF